jgi:plastocyanin
MKTMCGFEHQLNLPISTLLLALTLAVPIQCLVGGRVAAATVNVSFGNFSFSPRNVTINVGDTVVWSNTGGSHTVTGDGSDPFCGSGTIPTSCSHTFNTAGTFPYRCIPHASSFDMRGTVTVQSAANTPPSVTITNPATGAVFAAPANVTVHASASDAGGTITTVRLFADTTLVGAAATAPYSIVASNLAAGPHTLTMVAVDNGGLSSTSAVVNISVVTPVTLALSPPLLSNGLFQLNYSANAGLRYVIENSSDLANWTAVTTNTASGSNEKFEEAFNAGVLRFYRVGRLPNP